MDWFVRLMSALMVGIFFGSLPIVWDGWGSEIVVFAVVTGLVSGASAWLMFPRFVAILIYLEDREE